MLSWIMTTLQRNRARAFVDNVYAWYQTTRDVSAVMEKALHDQAVLEQDIGSVIDNVDRMVLHLGFYMPDSMGTLRRRNPELAQRFEHVSQQIVVVRNAMTSFLIRSQGPGPMAGEAPDEEARTVYYYRALNEVGFRARDLMRDLDREIELIWKDLEQVITSEQLVADSR